MRVVLLTLIWMVLAVSAAAQTPGYSFSVLLRTGDPVPGSATDTFSNLAWISANGGPQVLLEAQLSTPGGSKDAFFRVHADGTVTELRREGDAAPAGIGGTYGSIYFGRIASTGEIAWLADVPGTFPIDQSVIYYSASGDTLIAKEGDVAPGMGGETYTQFSAPSINASGEVVFHAYTTGNSFGIFHWIGGVTSLVVKKGDPSPGSGNYSLYYPFVNPAIDDAGDIWFEAKDAQGTLFVRISGGSSSAVVQSLDEAPDSGGRTLQLDVSYARYEAYATDGGVVFNAPLDDCFELDEWGEPEFYSCSLYAYHDGVLQLVGLEGEPAPVVGNTWSRFTESRLDASGAVAFTGGSTDGIDETWGLYVAQGGSFARVLHTGDPLPGIPDTTAGALNLFHFGNADRLFLLMQTTTGDDSPVKALLLATPSAPSVPSLGPVGKGLLGIALIASITLTRFARGRGRTRVDDAGLTRVRGR